VTNVQPSEFINLWTYSYFNYHWFWRSYARTETSYTTSDRFQFSYDVYALPSGADQGTHTGKTAFTNG